MKTKKQVKLYPKCEICGEKLPKSDLGLSYKRAYLKGKLVCQRCFNKHKKSTRVRETSKFWRYIESLENAS